jgi:uncharacterized RDD family membrane protein YckC
MNAMLTLPAPLWRRLMSAVYDGLLLAALWLAAVGVEEAVRLIAHLDRNTIALRLYLLVVGLGFFGWFWTRGGRSPGMSAWRLQLRRADGYPPGWPSAAIRYLAMLGCWALCLAPPTALLLPAAQFPNRFAAAAGAAVLAALCLLSTLMDGRRRAPHDRLSGTEVVLLPRG